MLSKGLDFGTHELVNDTVPKFAYENVDNY